MPHLNGHAQFQFSLFTISMNELLKRFTCFWGLFFWITALVFLCPDAGAVTVSDHHIGSRITADPTAIEGERIFFIRKRNVGGLLLGDIYSMKPDGSDVQRFSNLSDNYFVTELPQISRDGRSLAFISNFESWKSAFYTDAFIVDLRTGLFRRVTGYELKTAAGNFGTVTVQVEDPKGWAISPSAIRISHKGCSNFVSGNAAVLTVPANENIWVKAELAKAKGDLKVVNVQTGGNVELKLNLEAGSLSAEHVFPSNDGSLLAVSTNNENINFPFYTIALWNTHEYEMFAEVTGQRLGGDTWPAYSPDGSMLAFCTGQHTLNSLAVVPTANPETNPTILAHGSGFGIQAFCAQPAWSPDGSEIVFVYTAVVTSFLGTEIQSNLYKVAIDGGDPVQMTSYSGNEVVSRPSFSPDGNSIAFSLLKSYGDIFLLSDLINQTYDSDIYAIPSEEEALRKGRATPVALTSDGNSLDPSWGIVSSGVGISIPQIPVESFRLFQNYPNPFANATSIEYEVQELTHIKITVYDMLGRPVSVLVDRTEAAGHYRKSWDGKDFSGKPVPAGSYIYKTEADGHSVTRKMILKR